MENIAKGKVKLVRYTEDGAYLQPTINEGERIPTEELCVKEVDENGHEWDLYVIDDRDDDYEEKRDLFLENDGTYGVIALLNKYGVTTDSYEPETDEYYCEVEASPYQVVYDTSKSPEENQKSVRDYFEELFWNYPQYSPLELIYQIANFFKYHVIDVVECFGGMDGVNKFWKKLVEAYSLDPAHKEDLRSEIDEDVDKFVQDIELNIDEYCIEADEILKQLKKSKTPFEVECERIKLDEKRRELTVGDKVAAIYRRAVQMEDCDVSSVMMKYLHDLGIKTWLIGTKEDNGIRKSLMYVDTNGEPFVANPVADVEFFRENGINTPEERAKYLISDRYNASFRVRGDCHNYGRIPLQIFENMYGPISMYGDFYDKKHEGVKFADVVPKTVDVKEVYERLGKHWEYEMYEKRYINRKLREERRAKLNQGNMENQENPDDPDNQEL